MLQGTSRSGRHGSGAAEAAHSAAGGTPKSPSSARGLVSKLLSMRRSNSTGGNPVTCLICLENLTPEDFEVREAYYCCGMAG